MTYPVSSSDAGSVYVPPITRATFATPTTRALADAMKTPPNATAVQRRWATVDAVHADGTVDIIIDGLLKQKVLYDASYAPSTGEVVFIDVVGPDIVVMGTVAPSLLNPGHRKATVTAVNTTRTRVSLTVDDGTTLVNVPALAPYIPHVGDVVHVLSYLGEFVAAGSVSDTAQLSRRAIGQIEPSLVIKPGTLACTGQVVSRTTYAPLWAWVQANSLVKAGLFTNGDGSTTFGLPDWRGRAALGAGLFGGVTYNVGDLIGAASQTLTTAQMPAHNHSVGVSIPAHAAHDHNVGVSIAAHAAHDHNVGVTVATHAAHSHSVSVSVAAHGTHDHTITVGQTGSGGHVHNVPTYYSGSEAAGYALVLAGTGGQAGFTDRPLVSNTGANQMYTTAVGDHNHGVTADAAAVSAGTHAPTVSETGVSLTHSATVTESTVTESHSATVTESTVTEAHTPTVTESTVGGTTAVDVRSPAFVINWLIWT
ncbi:MAG: exported protein of unknown function [Marmoricola sp.]|nr:exported protein of unknown function [Marmoricola sp.]